MRQTGLRFDTTQLRKKLMKLGKVKAIQFLPDVKRYTRVVLNTCVKTTPARDLALIRTNQSRQYDNRISYIPSIHTLQDPTLIIKPDGTNLLYAGGKWYKPALWALPADVYSIYQQLLAEQLRRVSTPKPQFIAERAQARFLYKLSWVQCGESIGLVVRAPAAVMASHTRRKPPKNPPRGYAQVRGGDSVISIVIYNPFIGNDSKYNECDGEKILNDALQNHRSNFIAQTQRHLQRILYAVMHQ